MVLTHTTQFFSMILLPEKYDSMTFDDTSTDLNFDVKFKNGAIAFVPIYDGELLRGVKLPDLEIEGTTYTYFKSWTKRLTGETYVVSLPSSGVFVVHNNTSDYCSITETHVSSTTSFS